LKKKAQAKVKKKRCRARMPFLLTATAARSIAVKHTGGNGILAAFGKCDPADLRCSWKKATLIV
ncbi:hypothetical protein, partial [uncultured Desulfovibrio sp.]|uniref:hypothetical protein n=1 Tax=uncultured Desulfovibrio sp. TaxID=167968 RepID=UPI0026DCE437